MSRTSFFVRLATFLSSFNLGPLIFLDYLFLSFIQIFHRPKIPPAVFILAIPRSGSTLSYQCFSQYFSLPYLTNLSHFFYQLPAFSIVISKLLCFLIRPKVLYRSRLGFVDGLLGHAEGYRFWNHWLNMDLTGLRTNTLRSNYFHLIRSICC